jgi:hypothetical protein
MGSTKGPYVAEFLTGSKVRVKDRAFLEAFRQSWHYHHPLQPEQLGFAGREAQIIGGGVYHGGDELYTLADIPGIWHEQCLESV